MADRLAINEERHQTSVRGRAIHTASHSRGSRNGAHRSMTTVSVALALSLTCAFIMSIAGASATSSYDWSKLSPSTSPSARYSSAMAYDAASGKIILFGGESVSGSPSTTTYFSDTWQWDGSTWTQLSLSSHPSARWGARMAYDADSQKIILFGGFDGTNYLGDTWQWDGSTWTQVATTGPHGRDDAAIAYDPHSQQLILFSGYYNDGGDVYPSDTWSWSGTAWSQLNPTNHPDGRWEPSMAYDANSQKLVMFGGYIGGTGGHMFGDTWLWDGTNWTNANPSSSPSERDGTAMAYDEDTSQLILFGGFNWTCDYGSCDDTWAWTGTNWTQLTPPTTPDYRSEHMMAYDSSSHQLVMFGGYVDSQVNETWVYASSGPPADTQAPTTTATAKNADNSSYTFDSWTHQTVTVTLSATDTGGSGVASTSYQIDGGTVTAYSSPFQVSGQADHTVTYWSVDNATNEETHHTVHVKIDTSNPTTTASAKTADNSSYTFGNWTHQTVSVTLSASDTGGSGLATTFYTLDGGSQQTYSSPFNVSSQGDHTIVYWSADNAGNVETSHTVNVKLDLSAPTTTASAINTDSSIYTFGNWTIQTVSVTLSPADSGGSGLAGTFYTIDGGSAQSYTAPFDVTGDGDHVVTYWSTDEAGNVESIETVHVKIDATVPTTTATATNADTSDYTFGDWTNQVVTVTLTPSDAASGVESTSYTIDGGSTQTYTVPFAIATEGDHTVTFSSVDNVGNTETSQTVHVKIDVTKPTTAATAKNADNSSYTFGDWTHQTVTVTLTPSDTDGSGVASTSYKIDGGNTQTYSAPFDVSGEADHTVTFWSTDIAGNTETIQTVHVKIDLTAPTTTASATNADSSAYTFGIWTKQTVTVSLTPSDTGGSGVASTFYTIDGGSQQTYSAPFSISSEADHTVVLWSVDTAGNVEVSQTVHVMVDKSVPVVTYSGNQGTYTADQTVSITCAASDDLSGVASTTCVDIGGPAYSFNVGSNTFTASATDNAGNVGNGSVTFTVGVTVNSISVLTARFDTSPLGNMQLQSILTNIQRFGNGPLKSWFVNMYIVDVNMQRGRSLTSQQADTLIQLARQL